MLKIYNTLHRKKEIFKPLHDKKVSYYHCGPTVYSYQHIGTYRAAFVADIVVRTLQYFGYEVDFVTNLTDVGHLVSDEDEGEDKMEKAIKREAKSSLEIANFYTKDFLESFKKMNYIEPREMPRPSEHIKEQIALIKTLLEKGNAYITKSAIYFDTGTFPKYGQLSGQKIEEKEEGVRNEVFVDKEKKNPQDFALWFFIVGHHKMHELRWDSPWGKGFPGWHIECSAMSMKYLGQTIDIHSGGIEHIPVHHENEIAQSEAVTGKLFVRYWVHLHHLVVDNRKMSKSLGNVYLVQGKESQTGFKSIEELGFQPMDLRYFYLQAHYRTKQNFTLKALEAARNTRLKIVSELVSFVRQSSGKGKVIQKYEKVFRDALGDDFNTPQGLAVLFEVLDSDESIEDKYATILKFDSIFGLHFESITKETGDINQADEQSIEKLISFRQEARENEEWEQADKIRKELKDKFGVEIEDTSEGTIWKKSV